jgi:hypothetical protein
MGILPPGFMIGSLHMIVSHKSLAYQLRLIQDDECMKELTQFDMLCHTMSAGSPKALLQ